MADWTKSKLADRTLERLNIKAKNQDAEPADKLLVEEMIDDKHEELAKLGMVPFATSAIPNWAHTPMLNIIVGTVAPEFGFSGQSLASKMALEQKGWHDLHEQISNQEVTAEPRGWFF